MLPEPVSGSEQSAAGLPVSAVALRAALRAREISARDVAEQYLRRIADAPGLGAFIAVTEESALRDAERADRWLGRSATHPERRDARPLAGIPLAHKDLVDVAGAPTTRGSRVTGRDPARRDGPGVAVLRGAGAISVGKTQVPEFGLTGYSENLVAPPARNPHDPARTAGGSSGGSAAAVAAGLIPVAPCSDGGGSIRIPALACGLIGLKPGVGALATDRSAPDPYHAPQMSVSGPIARTAADAALLYDAMRGGARLGAGHGSADIAAGAASAAVDAAAGGMGAAAGAMGAAAGTAGGAMDAAAGSAAGARLQGAGSPLPAEPTLDAVLRADEVAGLRIGMSADSPWAHAFPVPISPNARAAYERAAASLEARGHRVEPVSFDYDERYPEAFSVSWTSGLASLELDEACVEGLVPYTRYFRERALSRTPEQFAGAAAVLRGFRASAREQWGRYDAVLTPGLAMPPPRVGEFLARDPEADFRLQCEWAPYTSMVNVSGLPAVAVPMGFGADGLPYGAHLIGREGSEALLLQLAAQLMG